MSSAIRLRGGALGAPVDGYIEYDGNQFYATEGTRMLLPAEQYFRLNSNFAGANVNTAQDLLPVDPSVIAGVQYDYELIYGVTKAAGVTSHTFATSFAGTATFNNFFRHVIVGGNASAATSNALAPLFHGYLTAVTSTVMTTAIAAAAANIWVRESGTFSVSGSGTIIPQYTLSAAPGGAYSTVAGSWMRIKPTGAAGANIAIGSWA